MRDKVNDEARLVLMLESIANIQCTLATENVTAGGRF
jgi:hypothetical protein